MSKALDKILLDVEDRMGWMPEDAPRTFAEEVAMEYAEKVSVAFAEWMNEPVEKYSHGCLLRATPQKPDYKTYYLRIEGQSLNSNTVFYTLPDLYQYFINNVYNQ